MPSFIGGTPTPARSAIVSPADLLAIFLNQVIDREIVPAGAVVGGGDDPEQQNGVVALMDAGNTKQELYVPLLWKRVQVRCMGPTLQRADQIGNYIADLLDNQKWLELYGSDGRRWFVHEIYVTAGTNHHIDSRETYESLLFVNITISKDPIPETGS